MTGHDPLSLLLAMTAPRPRTHTRTRSPVGCASSSKELGTLPVGDRRRTDQPGGAVARRDAWSGPSGWPPVLGRGIGQRFSLAARRLGADVRSFDYDPYSVACTRELKAPLLSKRSRVARRTGVGSRRGLHERTRAIRRRVFMGCAPSHRSDVAGTRSTPFAPSGRAAASSSPSTTTRGVRARAGSRSSAPTRACPSR